MSAHHGCGSSPFSPLCPSFVRSCTTPSPSLFLLSMFPPVLTNISLWLEGPLAYSTVMPTAVPSPVRRLSSSTFRRSRTLATVLSAHTKPSSARSMSRLRPALSRNAAMLAASSTARSGCRRVLAITCEYACTTDGQTGPDQLLTFLGSRS